MTNLSSADERDRDELHDDKEFKHWWTMDSPDDLLEDDVLHVAYEGWKAGRASLGAAQVPANAADLRDRLLAALERAATAEAALRALKDERAGAAQVPSLPPHLHISEMLCIYDEKGGDWLRIAREVEQRTFAALSQPSQQEAK